MQTLGEKLRTARIEKNVSWDEVYRRTKIHPKVLEAIEQGQADKFLSPLYVKGFLKAYAQYLGLDAEKVLIEYLDSQGKEPSVEEIPVEKKQNVLPKINLVLILRIFAVTVVLSALVLSFPLVLRHIFQGVRQTKERKLKVKVTPAPLLVETEMLLVEVKTLDNCWLRVKVDGQAIFEKTLPKGRRESWQAKEKIELRIGKPEALEVLFNGRPLDLKKEKVNKGLVITHKGIAGS